MNDDEKFDVMLRLQCLNFGLQAEAWGWAKEKPEPDEITETILGTADRFYDWAQLGGGS